MTTLRPMTQEGYAAFAAAANAGYAQDNTTSGRWSADDAQANASAEFAQLLPQGLETPNHFLFDILDEAVPAHVLTAALFERFASRGEDEFQNKVLSAMRFGFGGHSEKK